MNSFKLILIVSILCIVGSSCLSNSGEREELSKRIGSSLPIGSSRSDVEEFLKTNSIRYDWQPKWIPAPNGEDADWLVAWIERKSLIKGNYLLTTNFYFSRPDGGLSGYEVFESYKKTF